MKPKFPVWAIVILLVNVAASLLLARTCLVYFSMLNPPAVLGSRVDSRGGLWELQMWVPCLMLVTVIGNWMVPQNTTARKIAFCS